MLDKSFNYILKQKSISTVYISMFLDKLHFNMDLDEPTLYLISTFSHLYRLLIGHVLKYEEYFPELILL